MTAAPYMHKLMLIPMRMANHAMTKHSSANSTLLEQRPPHDLRAYIRPLRALPMLPLSTRAIRAC